MIEICAVGGYDEIGKNMTAVKVGDEVVVIDMGLHLESYIRYTEQSQEEMVEISHLKNEPWHKTLKEKGPFEKIDYMLAVDSMGNSLSIEEARRRMQERIEMHQIFF